MKQILPIGLITLISLGAAAIPAKKGVRTYTQADGTTISVSLVGDESFHSFVTTDGLAVRQGEDGNFYYVTAEGVSSMKAHNVAARTANELSFIEDNMQNMSVEAIAKARKASISARRAPQRVAARRESQVPQTGSPRIPVILVQYSDYSFKDSDPVKTFNSYFREGDVSAYQYFKDQSNGKYTPEFDLYGPVTLSGTRATYGANDEDGYDVGVGTMVGEACNLVNSSVDFSKYDNDGDGECDVVIVLYAGDGEASSYDSDAENSIWPCQWELSSSDYGKSLTLDKTKVNKFAVFNELYGSDLTKIDGIGTFCHEFSHCLDLPDFYDTNYGNHFGMGPWSLMDYGSYNDDGYTPIGYSAYEKEFMGWIDIEEGKENTFYTLPVFNQKNIDTDKAVKLTNAKDANEYYIIENRAQQGWDEYMPYQGMMITHVTYDESAWTGNTVNNYSTQRMTIIPADGTLKMSKYGSEYYIDDSDLVGDLWPYGTATELTDESSPAAKVYTGTYMSKPVTEIAIDKDGNATFWLMKGNLPVVETPVNTGSALVSKTSATISWEAADEADVTYTLEVWQKPDYTLVSSTDFASNNTWTVGGSAQVTAAGDYYLGSNKKTGSVTSPSFKTGEDGVVTVVFNAKYYDSGSSLKISLINASKTTVATKTIAMTDSYADYVVVLNGTANANMTVKLETLASKKRVYVSTCDIYNGDASELGASKAARAAATNKLTFTGITGTSYTVTDLEEGATYNYHVKAVPANAEEYAESAWSETKTFALSDYSGVEGIDADNAEAVTVWYTLQGIRLAGAPTTPGLYICRQGQQTTKVVVK
jgi:M6 family metalloprotease-like protein